MSDGSVSLTSEGAAVPVKILRDTGATQSLLLQDVLPLTEQSSTGTSVLVQGVELGILKVPLHKVYLRSSLVSGVVTVGVRPTLPIQGITFILGNDLAGGKVDVNPELQVIDEPEQPKFQGVLETESIDIFPACVMTRFVARKARGNDELTETVVPQSNNTSSQTEPVTADMNEFARIPEMTQSSPLSRDQLMTE